MDLFDQIIEALELERELGTRTVEIDRALLVAPSRENPPAAIKERAVAAEKPAPAAALTPPATPAKAAPAPESGNAVRAAMGDVRDFAFFTGKPLTPAGEKLFGKMVAAMGYTLDRVRVNEDAPAKIIVLMGSDALRAHAPQAKKMRGQWFDIGGVPAVTTFSPDYILSHFIPDSPEMKTAKGETWSILKSALARLAAMH